MCGLAIVVSKGAAGIFANKIGILYFQKNGDALTKLEKLDLRLKADGKAMLTILLSLPNLVYHVGCHNRRIKHFWKCDV